MHHSISLWMWILDNLPWHGNKINLSATSYYRVIKRKDHIQMLWSMPWQHKTITIASKILPIEISWAHPLPIRWRTGKNICPYVPTHARWCPGCQHSSYLSYILCLPGDGEIMFDPALTASLAQDCYDGWRKIVVFNATNQCHMHNACKNNQTFS